MDPPPRVGVGVFLFKGDGINAFVLGQRKGSHGAGTYALPGGHLDHGESFEECAAREVMEETGLPVHDVHFLTATNSVFAAEHKHYVTIFMRATVTIGSDGRVPEPMLLEPDKCESWQWSTFSQMRDIAESPDSALFQPLLDLMTQRPEICASLES